MKKGLKKKILILDYVFSSAPQNSQNLLGDDGTAFPQLVQKF